MQQSKQAYRSYFEVQLKPEDFGKSREEHNKICNMLLVKQLKNMSQDNTQLCDKVTNEQLISVLLFCIVDNIFN